MTTSQENFDDRLRRVLQEQAQALQVHPSEWQGEPRTVAHRRLRWSLPIGGLAVGLGGAVALLVAVGALVLVGNHHIRTKAAIGGRSPAHTATTPTGPPDCNAAGINDQQLREGTCVSGANTVVVVNKAGTLHLESLDAKLVALHRNGTSAILTIAIKNKLRTPERWQHTMANLYVAGTDSGAGNSPFYGENLDAETGDQNSCLWKTGTAAKGGLQPGASATCDLIFDIPAGADPAGRDSGLYIANFGEDVSNPSRLPTGIIRTYH